MLNLVI